MPRMGKVRRDDDGKLYADGRMVKTPIHREYEHACQFWSLNYRKSLQELRMQIKDRREHLELHKKTFALKVEYYFLINPGVLLTANNKPNQKDVDNFIKPTQDNLFNILEIDDKYCFQVAAHKIAGEPREFNSVLIHITETTMETKTQVFKKLGI